MVLGKKLSKPITPGATCILQVAFPFFGGDRVHHIQQIKEYKVINTSRDIVVINTDIDDYKAHAHFADIRGALECINLINRGLLPKSKYYQTACKRLLTPERYEGLVERTKEKYINVNKGVRR